MAERFQKAENDLIGIINASIKKPEEVLSYDDYIRCDRFRCTMKAGICIDKQTPKRTSSISQFAGRVKSSDPECNKCEQGAIIRKRLGGKEKDAKRCYKCNKPPKKYLSKGLCEICYSREYEKQKKENRKGVRMREKIDPVTDKNAVETKAETMKAKDINENRKVLTVDFSKKPKLLDSLHREAFCQFRTVNNQVLYFVHLGLEISRKRDKKFIEENLKDV